MIDATTGYDDQCKGAKRAAERLSAFRRFQATGCCGHRDQIIWVDGIDIGEDGRELRTWNRPACHWVPGLTCQAQNLAPVVSLFSRLNGS